jgi:hypothetical protein
MPGLLNVSSVMMCPHGGTVQAIPGNARVSAAGGFLLRPSDTFLIVGCPFVIGVVPSPCVEVQWVVAASGSQALGDATLTEASVGLCCAATQAVQGAVLIVSTQPRVAGL